MQEDIEGTLRSLHGSGYTINEVAEERCGLCGYPCATRLLTRRAGNHGEGIRSAYEDVCPECGRLLNLGGEPGFPPEDR